jgi:hypothetical protein
MGEVVAQVVKVRPGPVSTYRLPGGGCMRVRLVADGDPQPVQNLAVAGILVEARSIAGATPAASSPSQASSSSSA